MPFYRRFPRRPEKFIKYIVLADILYMTRVQKERFSDPMEYERVKARGVGRRCLQAGERAGKIRGSLRPAQAGCERQRDAVSFREACFRFPDRVPPACGGAAVSLAKGDNIITFEVRHGTCVSSEQEG